MNFINDFSVVGKIQSIRHDANKTTITISTTTPTSAGKIVDVRMLYKGKLDEAEYQRGAVVGIRGYIDTFFYRGEEGQKPKQRFVISDITADPPSIIERSFGEGFRGRIKVPYSQNVRLAGQVVYKRDDRDWIRYTIKTEADGKPNTVTLSFQKPNTAVADAGYIFIPDKDDYVCCVCSIQTGFKKLSNGQNVEYDDVYIMDILKVENVA